MCTDKDFYLKKEVNKIENSALKVGLNKSKVDRIFKDKIDVISSNSSVPSNCDNVSNNESSNCDIVSNSNVSSTNCYVLMPFINSKLGSEVTTFFHNHNVNVKVSFRTGRNLYTLLRPRVSNIKGKYLQANVFTNTNAIAEKGITLVIRIGLLMLELVNTWRN